MTKKELAALRAQIEEYLPELKAEIDGAKNDLKNARSLKTQIEGIVDVSDGLVRKLQDPTDGVDALLTKGSSGVADITANSESAQALLTKIDEALTAATAHVGDMDLAYANFNNIKAKIDDPETGLNVTLTQIKQVRARAKEAATKTESILKTADKTLVNLQTYIANIDKAYAAFLDSKKKVDDPTEGLEAILKAMKKLRDNISSVADKSTTLFTQISSYKDEASNSLKDINGHKSDSEVALGNIRQHESDSEAAKKSIENLLNIASQESSTAYFRKRTVLVTIIAAVWLFMGIVALIVAVILGHEFVRDVLKNDAIKLTTVVARILVVTPVIAFAFYAFRNYGKERNIAEQYAFKEISGATLEGHVEMAHRAFPESTTIDGKLEQVVEGVLKDIHSEPTELQKTPRNTFRAKTKLVDIEAELTDIGENVEDIKNTVVKDTPSLPAKLGHPCDSDEEMW